MGSSASDTGAGDPVFAVRRHTLPLSWALRHCEGAAQEGLDREFVFARSHIPPVDGGSGTQIDSNNFALLCINLICMLDDELHGSARHKMRAGLVAMGVRAMLGADHLGDGIRRLLRFFQLVSPVYSGKLSVANGRCLVTLRIDTQNRTELPGEEVLIAAIHMYASWFAQRVVPLRYVYTRCAEHPALTSPTRGFLRCQTVLSDVTGIEFPAECLHWERRADNHETPVSDAVAFAFDHIWNQTLFARHAFPAHENRPYSQQVLDLLDRDPFASSDAITHQLHLPRTTLWRCLRGEGATFSSLRQVWVIRKTFETLRGKPINNDDLSFELGFADARSMRAALKYATGMTPSQIRSQIADCAVYSDELGALRSEILRHCATLDN